jgi:hypothetical protein
MATAAQIAALRQLVNEPTTTPFDDATLGDLIDSLTVDGAAAEVWTRKAASLSSAVDMSEGGSSRKNSDLMRNATAMAALFRGRVNDQQSSSGRTATRISKITRL